MQKCFEEDFRQWCEAKAEGRKKKKVTEVYHEAVQVRHELWSDDEEGTALLVSSVEPATKKSKLDVVCSSDCFAKTAIGKITIAADTSSDEEEEESEDEDAAPIEDKPVLMDDEA